MPTPTDVHAAEQAARQLLDARRDEKIVSIRELALARQASADAQAAADAAARADAAAWATALRNGWTEADLKAVGYDPPSKRSPGRPARRKPAAPAPPGAAPNGTPAALAGAASAAVAESGEDPGVAAGAPAPQ